MTRWGVPPVEVIVYAHAPVAEIQICLESALRNFSGRDFIIVQEAQADPDVSAFLSSFVARHQATLMENFDWLGYWKSVMKAVDRASADYLVVLETSSVFSRNGLCGLVDPLHADASLEVALPLNVSASGACENFELLATALENSKATVSRPVRSTAVFTGCPVFAIKRSATSKLASWRHDDAGSTCASDPLEVGLASGCCALDPSREVTNTSFEPNSLALNTLERLFRKSALFLIADHSLSVLLEVLGLRDCGLDASAVISSIGSRWIAQNLPGTSKFWVVCDDDKVIPTLAADFDFVIATDFQTGTLLQKLRASNPKVLPLYYLRDYEPWSLADHSAQQEAERTLTACGAEFHFFSRSEWLSRTMWQRHRIQVAPVAFGLDRCLYNGFHSKQKTNSTPLVIACPIRPASPAGNARNALRIIRKVAIKYGRKVEVRVFGCTDEELDQMDEARGFRFQNLALLNRVELAEFFRSVDLFADLSLRQSEGSSGLEAMAAGCAAILPIESCPSDIARDGENCVLTDSSDERAVLRAFDRLIANRGVLTNLQDNAIETGRSHPLSRTVWSQLLLLAEISKEKAKHAAR